MGLTCQSGVGFSLPPRAVQGAGERTIVAMPTLGATPSTADRLLDAQVAWLLARITSADVDDLIAGVLAVNDLHGALAAEVRYALLSALVESASAHHVARFHGADAVVHLAWLIQPRRDRRLTYAVNVPGSARVFGAERAARTRLFDRRDQHVRLRARARWASPVAT